MPPFSGFLLLLVLACWVFAGTPSAASQLPEGRLPFRSYGAEAGLSNLAITCMAQDPQGFLWVGTQGSLFRYDGRSFEAFGLREGLPSGSITALAMTPQGALWVGTFRGTARFEGGRFKPLPGPTVPVHMIRARGSEVWLATASGLFCARDTGPITPVPGWQGEARALWLSEDGTLWASRGTSLFQSRPGGPWEPRILPGASERILDVVGDPRGRVYIRTPTRLLSLGPEGFRDVTPPMVSSPSEDARMVMDAQNRLWIATNAGLWVLKEGRWEALGPLRGLPTASPNTVLLDREGSLWVAGQGVHRLLGRGLWTLHGEPEGLPHANIWGIVRDLEGTLWVATNGGLARSEGKGWQTLKATSGQSFRALAMRREGGVWA